MRGLENIWPEREPGIVRSARTVTDIQIPPFTQAVQKLPAANSKRRKGVEMKACLVPQPVPAPRSFRQPTETFFSSSYDDAAAETHSFLLLLLLSACSLFPPPKKKKRATWVIYCLSWHFVKLCFLSPYDEQTYEKLTRRFVFSLMSSGCWREKRGRRAVRLRE